MVTCSEVKSDTAQEVVADKTVKVPDGQFNTTVLELDPRDALKDEGMVPRRVTGASYDWTFM